MNKLDMSAEARQRRNAEIENRMTRSAATGPARATERRRVEAEVETEDVAAAKASSDRTEAAGERSRIASVVRLGRDRDRGRQALRAALLAPIGADAAAGLIAALPRDDAASVEALAVPSFVVFGSAAAQSERLRITRAFARPEAEGRFGATCAMVIDGEGGLTAEQIAPLLATMPTASPPIPGPGKRWQADVDAGIAVEFGGDAAPIRSKAEAAKEGWSKAAAAANASSGAGLAMPAAPMGQPMSNDKITPFGGLTAEGRATVEAALRAQAGGHGR